LGPGVSQFLTALSDLVNPGERGLPPLQVLLARVDVGLLRERRVIVTRPLADDRDRHARVLHERQGRVTRVVQGDPPQPGPPQQSAELVGIPLGVNRSASLIGDHVLAALLERYVTIKKNGRWIMRNCEAVLYVTSLDAAHASPADLLAYARGHWTVEHLHWLRDVVWREDKSTLRTGNAPEVMSALTNLVITLFRLQGVTKITAETRRNAQNPRRPLQLLALRPG